MIPVYLIALGIIVALILVTVVTLLLRYKRCPSDKLLIVYGSTHSKASDGSSRPFKVIHGKGAFIWPFIQDYSYLSLTPILISTTAKDILSKQKINVSFPVNLTVQIDTSSPQRMLNAASSLLSMPHQDLLTLLENNLKGGLRAVVAQLEIEQLNEERDTFLSRVSEAILPSLDAIGLKIVDINMEDLSDNDRYLENLSKRAVTKAEAEALANIAEMERDGATKKAIADKEKAVNVGQTNQEKAITLAEIDKKQAEELAEINKNKESLVAEKNAEKRKNVANSNTAALTAEAVAKAAADTKTAEADATAAAQMAKVRQESLAQQAEYAANTEAKKAEAKAEQLIRTNKANAKQAAESEIAHQDQIAREKEALANQEQRAALADQKAKVTKQQALAAIATAEGDTEKARQEAQQKAGMAKVLADTTVAKDREDRQFQVEEARAKAAEAALKATKIVPANAAKEVAEIEANQEKNVMVIKAAAEGAAALEKAKGEAAAILEKAKAEAQQVELAGAAKAAAAQAMFNAQVERARGLSMAEVAGFISLAEKLGDPQAAVQFFMKEVTRDIKTAEAYAGSLREIMGNVTVYGGDKTATSFADGLLGLLPKIKEMGTVLGQTIATGKEAIAEGKNSPDSVDDLGEKEFEDK